MISATVLTKNSAATLGKTLDSLRRFQEVIVFDSGSTDGTLSIASSYPNVTVHSGPFEGFGPAHNLASEKARFDWILSIDSDEALTKELEEEILTLSLDPQTVYAFRRDNYFNGKQIKWCAGWHPDWVMRLYHRKHTQFSDDLVHEKILTEGMHCVRLNQAACHIPYQSYGDFLKKMQHYTDLYADSRPEKKGSVFNALFRSWAAFFKSYILKRGFLGGQEGLFISLYNAHTTFYKYVKVSERSIP